VTTFEATAGKYERVGGMSLIDSCNVESHCRDQNSDHNAGDVLSDLF